MAEHKRRAEPSARRSIFISKVSWGAILAGALVAIVVQIVLSMLGIAIGASAINPTESGGAFSGLGIGAALWWVVTALISLFTGAWVAGRMASITNSFEGMMHGIIVWCVATFIGLMMITTTVGQIMSGAFGVVGQAISVAGEAAPQAAQALQQDGTQARQQEEDALEGIMAEMRQLIQESDQQQTQAQQQQQNSGPFARQQQQQQQQQQAGSQELEEAVSRLLQEGDVTPQQRQQVVNMLVENTRMNEQRAEQTVENWISTYQEASSGNGINTGQIREQAEEVGDDVADALATAAFWSFIALVLGAIVAGVGGSMAAPAEGEIERDEERPYRDPERTTTAYERDPNDPTYRSAPERRGQEPGKTNPARNEPRMPGDPNPDEPRGNKGRNPGV
ncbi:MAG: hypothetical protein WD266_07880 [Balneolales bacterium]